MRRFGEVAADNEDIGAGFTGQGQRMRVDAAIDLDEQVGAQIAESRHLCERRMEEGLAPQPGFTVITRTRSTRSRIGTTASTGVPGLMATPACRPIFLRVCASRWLWLVASAWKMILPHPAAAKASNCLSGLATIRWASKRMSTAGRNEATYESPKVIGGTNWPSMTSR